MIRLGVCMNMKNARIACEKGYDYLELQFAATALLAESEYQSLRQEVLASPLPVEVMNCMVPGGISLCSPAGSGDEMQQLLTTGFARAHELGVRLVVFGSGNARRIPDGMTPEKAYAYILAFLRQAAGLAAPYGIAIAIEPLRTLECNFINSIREAQKLACDVNEPNVGAMADLYHIAYDGDDMTAMGEGPGILHAHIAHPISRSCPKPGDGYEGLYKEFFGILKEIGYEGRVSIEGNVSEFSSEELDAYSLLDQLRR